MQVIILAGGRGTRLPVSSGDAQKVLVEIHGKPMVAHHIDRLLAAGFENIRLALGHRAEQVVKFLGGRGYSCSYVIEPEPLGTGGAVRLASQGLENPFMVLNGDVYADFDFPAITRAHRRGEALLVSYWRDDTRDFGLLELSGDRVGAFLEKPRELRPGYINAGCYVLEPEHLASAPDPAFMLETDVFPKLAAAGQLANFTHRGSWEDLGTEERLRRARSSAPR